MTLAIIMFIRDIERVGVARENVIRCPDQRVPDRSQMSGLRHACHMMENFDRGSRFGNVIAFAVCISGAWEVVDCKYENGIWVVFWRLDVDSVGGKRTGEIHHGESLSLERLEYIRSDC